MARRLAESGRGRALVVLLLAAVAAAALAVAGCGGDGSAEARPGDVTGFVPSGSPAYLEVTTEVDGRQWTQVGELARRFPGFPRLQERIDDALRSADLDFDADIKPLLGERAAVAALRVPEASEVGRSLTSPSGGAARAAESAGFVAAVALAEDGEDGMRRLLQDSGGSRVGEHEGVEILADADRDTFAAVTNRVLVISDSQASVVAALEAHRRGRDGTLAGDARFEDALAALPEDVFAKAYVDLGALLASGLESSPQAAQLGELGEYRDAALAASVIAEPEGVRVKGVLTGVPTLASAGEFTPTLTERVPADAIAYLGFSDVAGTIAQILGQIQGSAGDDLRQQLEGAAAFIPAALGVSLDDLRALGSGEHALVLAEAAPRVGAALALQVEDGARAQRTLDRLRERVPALLAGDEDPPRWRQVPLAGGVQGWQLPIADGVGVVYGVDERLAILGTTPRAVRAIQRPGATLAASPAFQQATRGIPERVTSLLWVNVGEALSDAEALGAFRDAPPEALANLRPLRSLVGWTTGGERPTFELFARIRGR